MIDLHTKFPISALKLPPMTEERQKMMYDLFEKGLVSKDVLSREFIMCIHNKLPHECTDPECVCFFIHDS